MPGCCLPSLTAATALHFTAGCLKPSHQQKPTLCVAFLGGNSPLPVGSAGAISLPCKKHSNPSINYGSDKYELLPQSLLALSKTYYDNNAMSKYFKPNKNPRHIE
jgi:hypothetical protein